MGSVTCQGSQLRAETQSWFPCMARAWGHISCKSNNHQVPHPSAIRASIWVRNVAEMLGFDFSLHSLHQRNFVLPFMSEFYKILFFHSAFLRICSAMLSEPKITLKHWGSYPALTGRGLMWFCFCPCIVSEFVSQTEAKMQQVSGARLGYLTKCESLLMLI